MKENRTITHVLTSLALFFITKHLFAEDEKQQMDDNGSGTIPSGTASDYVAKYKDLAKLTEQYYAVPAAFTLAQAGLESGWGTSDVAVNANNHFGIKADSSWVGSSYKGYRKYADVQNSYFDHAKFLTTNLRYSNAFTTSDANEFAGYIASDGYSTNPQYQYLILQIIPTVQKYL